MFTLYKNNKEIYSDKYWNHCVAMIIWDYFGKDKIKSVNCFYLSPEFSFITKENKEYEFELFEEQISEEFFKIFSTKLKNLKEKEDGLNEIRKLRIKYELSDFAYKIK